MSGRIPAPTARLARRALEAPCAFKRDASVPLLLRRWMVMPEAVREVFEISMGDVADAALLNARCDVCRLCPHRQRKPIRRGEDPSDVCRRYGGELVIARASVASKTCEMWPETKA